MKKIDVELTTNPYSIYLLDNFDGLNQLSSLFTKYQKVLVVTDDIVENLYLDRIMNYLNRSNNNVYNFVIKNGESSKNINSILEIMNYLVLNQFHRGDLIVALGGGVVGDLSGFAASIYMRGIDFIQIPTTLLAAVDASIGGKTGIDTENGKNLVGTFYQPKAVIQILPIYKELPDSIFTEGLSEVIKYGFIYDKQILELVEDGVQRNLEEIIYRCAKAKAVIVSKDEKESGLRKILNFGHTFGHALEKYSNYKMSHGVAVAYGMMFEGYLSLEYGLCSEALYCRLKNIVQKHIEIEKIDYPVEELVGYMQNDKKNNDSNIVFAVPTDNSYKILQLHKNDVIDVFRKYIQINHQEQ